MLGFNSCVIALSPDATDPVVIVISFVVVFPALSVTTTWIVYSVFGSNPVNLYDEPSPVTGLP